MERARIGETLHTRHSFIAYSAGKFATFVRMLCACCAAEMKSRPDTECFVYFPQLLADMSNPSDLDSYRTGTLEHISESLKTVVWCIDG